MRTAYDKVYMMEQLQEDSFREDSEEEGDEESVGVGEVEDAKDGPFFEV